jgi:hypothetical protein
MSAKREFNLFPKHLNSLEDDREDILCFSMWEISRDTDDDGEIGLSIDFTIDSSQHDDDKPEVVYDIYRTWKRTGKPNKEKIDTIPIAYCINDTDEIRDLADWLHEQADKIDEQKESLKNE